MNTNNTHINTFFRNTPTQKFYMVIYSKHVFLW